MAFDDLPEREQRLIIEHGKREHERWMQDPEFRRGWDRIEDLYRRAAERDAAVAALARIRALAQQWVDAMPATVTESVGRVLFAEAGQRVLDAIDHEAREQP
ncbi:hypothetical protein ACQEU3_47055 [Spirillospora sp. CA-253888]